jgi:crossover junction endodeoxyribonuclease RuvC
MLVLAVDPGTLKAGVSLMIDQNLLTSMQIKIGTSSQDMSVRLLNLSRIVYECIEEFRPEGIILEDGFIGGNMRTSMYICMARAAVMISAAKAGVPVYMYAPKEVKLAFTGTGKADKELIKETVKSKYNISNVEEDQADAIAIAYTHWVIANRPVPEPKKVVIRKGKKENDEHSRGLQSGRRPSSSVSRRKSKSSGGTDS